MNPVVAVLGRLSKVQQSKTGWTALCPSHDDHNPSLSVSQGDDGKVLLKCFAGCETAEIVSAIGLHMRDLFPNHDTTLSSSRGPTLTVSDLARDKGIPEEFLRKVGVTEPPRYRGMVGITYHLADGSLAPRQRLRSALSAKSGSSWTMDRPGEIVPYGLSHLREAISAEFLVLVEGESDCWTLWYHGYPALGIPSANMSKTLQLDHLDKGIKALFIIQENDEGGLAFVRGITRRLCTIGWQGSASVVTLPDNIKDPNELHKLKPDLFKEVFQCALAVSTTLTLPKEQMKKDLAKTRGQAVVDRKIQIGNDFPKIAAKNRQLREITSDSSDALAAANEPPHIFVHGGALVRVIRDEKGRQSIKALGEADLRGLMTRSADYGEFDDDGEIVKHKFPPPGVVRDLLSLGDWPDFPGLEAIVEVPVLRSDGTIVAHPGYDKATSLVYAPPAEFNLPAIPNDPTRADLESAKQLIDEAIGQFPYVDQASKANTLALLLSCILRQAIAGKVPLALLDAPQAGTGKSLLSEVIAVITTGRPAAMMGAPRDVGLLAQWALCLMCRGELLHLT